MNSRSDLNERGGKPYAKPAVKRISLRPEEAVLGACKIAGISGPGQASCSVPSGCSSLAS